MMPILVVVVAVAVAAYVLRPLFVSNGDSMVEPDARAGAEVDKARSLAALLELDEDEAAGKLTAEDAAGLRPTVEREALQAIDRARVAGRAVAADDDLEREIAEAARRLE